jgi:hypothetical protein
MRFSRVLLLVIATGSVGWTLYLVANLRIPGVSHTADYLTAHAEKVTPTTADDMYLGSLALWALVLVAMWFVLRRSGSGSGGGRAEVGTPAGWEPVELPTRSRFGGRG